MQKFKQFKNDFALANIRITHFARHTERSLE